MIFLIIIAMDSIFLSPQNSYAESLNPKVTMLEDGAFGIRLGHESGAN